MTVRLEEIGPRHLEDVLGFFDSTAFTDNPDWADCYCMFHLMADGWDVRGGEENRRDLVRSVEGMGSTALLAYDGDRLVGWCRYGARSSFPTLTRWSEVDSTEGVGSVVCFLTDPGYRRRGLAARLLAESCAVLARQGFRFAEGYPRRVQDSDAEAYEGPLSMYREAGFEVVDDRPRGYVVRRSLA